VKKSLQKLLARSHSYQALWLRGAAGLYRRNAQVLFWWEQACSCQLRSASALPSARHRVHPEHLAGSEAFFPFNFNTHVLDVIEVQG